MPPLSQSFIIRPILRVSSILSWKAGTGSKKIPHNLRESGQGPATPLRHTHAYGTGWDPLKGTERTGGSAH